MENRGEQVGLFGGFKADKRLKELEEGFADLKREIKGLQLEWTDTLDRVRRLMGRIAKRAALYEQAEQEGAVEPVAASDQPGNHSPLTARQLQIQQSILSRRRLGGKTT